MKQKTVVTNLRIPQDTWHEVKSIAAQEGVSVNKYINQLIDITTTKRTLGKNLKKIRPPKKSIFEALRELAKIPNEPFGELSEDDKFIYEHSFKKK